MSSILKVDTIQDQDGNNIINESANTITIGALGDTITIPSGATLANSGIITGFESTGIDDNATETTITIDSDERVKIVSGSPTQTASTLTLKDDGATTTGAKPRLGFQDSANTYLGELGYASNQTSDLYLTNIQNANLLFGTNNAERMRITSSGNVGIGTSSPSNRLDVVSGALTNSFHSSFYGLKIVNSTTNPARINLQNSQGTAVIDANNNLLRFRGSGGTDDMVIDSSGNVGIGTSSPGTALQVEKDWVGNYGSINISHSTDSLGGLGIRCNDVFKSALIYKGGTSGALLDIGTYDAEPIVFRTSNSERMRIDSSGRLLVNTTGTLLNSEEKFAVSGGLATFEYANSTSVYINRPGNDGGLVAFFQADTLDYHIPF